MPGSTMTRTSSLSDAVLRDIAGATVFARGQAYLAEERVTIRKSNATEVAADVSGTDDYRTRLWFEAGELHSTCSCPHADEGAFCKHMVATALAWRDSLGAAPAEKRRKAPAPPATAEAAPQRRRRTPRRAAALPRRAGQVILKSPVAKGLQIQPAIGEREFAHRAFTPQVTAPRLLQTAENPRRCLRSGDRGTPELRFLGSWLAEQLLQAATADPVLEKRLLLAARTRRAGDDLKALEKALSEAIANPGVLDWRSPNRFARRLDAPIDHLAQLLDAGRAQAALGGCLYLLQRLLAIYEPSDDSGGSISERVRYLGRLTDKALRAVKPGKVVALKVVDLALADQWAVFDDADHTEWFDAAGRAAFEAEIEKRFRALKPLPPGKSRFTSGDDRFRLQSWMERIAQRRGDIDRLVALRLGGDDVSAYDHLRAAEALEDAGRLRDATALLERAARQFDEERLLLKLEQNYRRDGCDADADALLWRRFEQRPRREGFAQLLAAAGKRWLEWRERACAAIAAAEAANLAQVRKWQRDAVADPGLRLACLVEEGRIDEAAALAESQPLPIRTLEDALRLLADKRPETAFNLLRRWLPHALRDSGISHYQRVGEMPLDVGRHQPAVRFASFLAQLRAEQARRPPRVEILDGVARQLAGTAAGRAGGRS